MCGSLTPIVNLAIRLIDANDAALLRDAEVGVFDHAPVEALTDEFLKDARHHLVGAIADGVLVGFVSAVHYVHPDKAPELWINEVGVGPGYRSRGIGKRMLEAMLAHGRELGCVNAWVLTDRANAAAMSLYESAGGTATPCETVTFEFPIGDTPELPSGKAGHGGQPA